MATWVLLALCLCAPQPALAQLKGGLALQSDNRFRGLSISGGRPTLSLDLSADLPSGLYVGGTITFADVGHDRPRVVSETEYLGYAVLGRTGRSWDFGLNNQTIEAYGAGRRSLHYTDLYAGVASGGVSARIYYSPNYFTAHTRAVYAEVNGERRLDDAWRLYGHVGVLAPLGGADGSIGRRERLDLAAGVARRFEPFEARLGWTEVYPRPTPATSQSRGGLLVGISAFF